MKQQMIRYMKGDEFGVQGFGQQFTNHTKQPKVVQLSLQTCSFRILAAALLALLRFLQPIMTCAPCSASALAVS